MVWGGVCVGGGGEREGERRGMRGDHPALHPLHPSLRPQHGPHLHGGPGGRRWCGEVGGGGREMCVGEVGIGFSAGGEGRGGFHATPLHPSLRPQHGPHLHGASGSQRWCGEVCVCVWGGGGGLRVGEVAVGF